MALFFSPDEEERNRAKALCVGCPVRQECYMLGVEAHDTSGPSIWGGIEFPDEYRRIQRVAAKARSLAEEAA